MLSLTRTTARMEEVRLIIPSAAAAILVVSQVRKRSQDETRRRFVFDCTGLADVPATALAELVALRAKLDMAGSEIALINCAAAVRGRLTEANLSAFPGALPTNHQSHSLRGPHSAFRRMLQASA
jgi:hypothetical protein